MCKIKALAFLGLSMIALSQNAYAILSPLNQSLVEINTLINSPEMADAFASGEAIQEIRHIERGYVVRSQNKEIFVEVVYQPSTRPGPAVFQLHFHLDNAR